MAQHGIAICGQIIYPFFCNDAEIFSVCFCRQPVMILRSLFFQFRGVFTVYVAVVPRHTLSHIRVQHCSSAITHAYTERSVMTLSSGHISARLHGRHLLIWFSHSRIGEVPQGGLGFSPPNPWSWTIFFSKRNQHMTPYAVIHKSSRNLLRTLSAEYARSLNPLKCVYFDRL